MYMTLWLCMTLGVSLSGIEHPKGDYYLFCVVFFGHIARLRLRLADFLHLLYCDFYVRGFLLHDLCAILGNIDIVFGSVDR
jgi:NADH:ubiquinone oxidoreductase subunit D